MTVTKHFGILGEVPFYDVDVEHDTPMFLDPSLICINASSSSFAAQAYSCFSSIADLLFSGVMDPTSTDGRRAQIAVKTFREPFENRLGLSSRGVYGHGGGDAVGLEIWDSLRGSSEALIKIGVLGRFEELPLFVKGLGNDLLSDFSTRVAYAPLVKFTQNMMRQFPELANVKEAPQLRTATMWDLSAGTWTEKEVLLPVANGLPLLLVPKLWLGSSPLLTARRYHDKAILDHVQESRTVLINGRPDYPSKKALRKDPFIGHSCDLNRRMTLEAFKEGKELLPKFVQWTELKYLAMQEKC